MAADRVAVGATNHLLLAVVVGGSVTALVAPDPRVAVAVTFVVVIASNYLELVPYIPQSIIRRPLRHLPYFLPLPLVGVRDDTTWPTLVLACAPVVVLHLSQVGRIRLTLSRALGRLMPAERMVDKVSESLFFGLPGVSQEYLHRFALLSVLAPLGTFSYTGLAAAATSSVTFALEHVLTRSTHTPRSLRNIVFWACIGGYFALIVVLTGSLVAVMCAHVLLNLPAALRPFFRPTERKLTS